jgi:ribonuclease HI
MIIETTTDGSCSPNPGPGGWACIFRAGGYAKAIYGYEPPITTNIRMEMLACIKALEHLKRPCQVNLYTDSQFVIDGITKWIYGWKKNGYQTREKKEVANKALWMQLDQARNRHEVQWVHVKGHADHKDNLLCDELANKARFTRSCGTTNLSAISKHLKPSDLTSERSITLNDEI